MSEKLSIMETFFLALGDRTRLRLLNLMREGEVCVCYFTEALQELQPKISRHLAYLRQAELVETTREGKWVYYRIAEPKDQNAVRVLSEVFNWLANDEQMQQDRARLIQINCCEPENMPDAIRNAPRPVVFQEANMSERFVQIERETQEELADYLL